MKVIKNVLTLSGTVRITANRITQIVMPKSPNKNPRPAKVNQ